MGDLSEYFSDKERIKQLEEQLVKSYKRNSYYKKLLVDAGVKTKYEITAEKVHAAVTNHIADGSPKGGIKAIAKEYSYSYGAVANIASKLRKETR